MSWSAEITNNPQEDYALYIELLEDEQFRGRIERQGGQLVLVVYGSDAGIPVNWLLGVLQGAEKDLVP